MITETENYKLHNFYEDIAKVSSILLRKDISTKEIYIILLAAKLINKNFNIDDIATILEHVESLFAYLQNNKFGSKEEFSKWEKQMLNKLNKNQENI